MGHKIRAIKRLFNWLVEEELLSKNPTLKLSEPKSGNRIPKALTIDELELLKDACDSSLEHTLAEFCFASGCRVAEIHENGKQYVDEVAVIRPLGDDKRAKKVLMQSTGDTFAYHTINLVMNRDPAVA